MRAPVPLTLVLLAVSAPARGEAGKVEIGLFGGASLLGVRTEASAQGQTDPSLDLPYGFEFRSTSTLGKSFLLGFRAGYGIHDRLQVEVSFAAAPSAKQRTEFAILCDTRPCPFILPDRALPTGLVRRPTEDKVAAYHYDAGLLVSLGGRFAQPFVTAGLGGVSYDAPDRGHTNFAFNFGAGVRIGNGGVQARIEASDHVVVDHYLSHQAEHDVQLRGGVSIRLP
jgi:Outer membrane protein beta-barrel domain